MKTPQYLASRTIGQGRHIKIQPKPIDLNTWLWGITTELFPEPRAKVYCVRLNFNISKLVNFVLIQEGAACAERPLVELAQPARYSVS